MERSTERIKGAVSSCSGERSRTRRNFKSRLAISRAAAYEPSYNGIDDIAGPYSSSSSRLRRAALSRGLRGRREVERVAGPTSRGRKGKRYVKREKELENSL